MERQDANRKAGAAAYGGFLNGMDVSFLDEIEAAGGTYGDGGVQDDAIAILKRSGVNSIRLQIGRASCRERV